MCPDGTNLINRPFRIKSVDNRSAADKKKPEETRPGHLLEPGGPFNKNLFLHSPFFSSILLLSRHSYRFRYGGGGGPFHRAVGFHMRGGDESLRST